MAVESVEVRVPSVGESITEVTIGRWLKKQGDRVARDEPLVELETDKATVEAHASVAGTLVKMLKQQGESANVGDVIAYIEEEGAAQAAPREEGAAQAPPSEEGAAAQAAPREQGAAAQAVLKTPPSAAPGSETRGKDAGEEPRVMPAAQRLLDEHGLDARAVEATGPGGRLLKEDVQRYADSRGGRTSGQTGDQAGGPESDQADEKKPAARPAAPAAAPAPGGDREEEVVPMSPLRRTIARRLVEAHQNAALTTTYNEIDMSGVMALRNDYKDAFEKRHGVRLGFMSFFVKAAIDGLKQIPQLNAEVRDQSIVYKNYYDIAVAVSTPKGLVTPVLRNAERRSFAEIEKAIGDFGRRAQENKLGPDELRGGTFTISNGGVFGSLLSTPIVNPPQSGVLGMHAIQERPVAHQGQVVIRPMMYVALTYDHRIVDGREAVTFLVRVKEALEDPARLVLDL
jgi:2-oxoglutarate dehydrogenase E2 component (dihydrolipoamide succinyltransferase)